MPTEVTSLILKGNLDVRQSPNTTLIEIRVFSEDKEEAASIANAIAEVYRDSPLAAPGPAAKAGVQIVDRAEPGLRPVRPNRPLAIAIGFGVGAIFAALGFVLILISRKRPILTRPE